MKKLSFVQEAMINALIDLMKKDKFKDITVTQITQEAGIARKTFYLNFNSKESIIELAIKHYSIVFQKKLTKENEITLENLAITFFMFSKEHLQFIQLLIENDLFTILSDEFESFIENQIVMSSKIKVTNGFKHLPSRYTIPYHSAGLCKLLKSWINSGMIESPREMGRLYTELVKL